MADLLATPDSASSSLPLGTLYGLGVGPGDPELITLKALKRLQAAPVVAFPSGIRGQMGVAESIVSPWLSAAQTRLPLAFPYVLDTEQLSAAWQQAAQTVWPYLQTGDVVFACEGDVSFYGTFTYLAQSLQRQYGAVKIEAIAGVSSPMAAAAALGIPLTCQGQRLAILPALYNNFKDNNFKENFIKRNFKESFKAPGAVSSDQNDSVTLPGEPPVSELEAAIAWADVIVLMKLSSVYRQVWQVLAQHQLLESSYVIENATKPDQVIYTDLQHHPDLKLPYFSLLIVQPRDRPNLNNIPQSNNVNLKTDPKTQ